MEGSDGSALLYKRWVMPQERDLACVSFIKKLGEGQRTSSQLCTVLFLAGQRNDLARGSSPIHASCFI